MKEWYSITANTQQLLSLTDKGISLELQHCSFVGGKLSPTALMPPPPGVSSSMTSAFASAANPTGLQPAAAAAGNPNQGLPNQISPFTKAKAIGDDIFGAPTDGQQVVPSAPQNFSAEVPYQAKISESAAMQSQISVSSIERYPTAILL